MLKMCVHQPDVPLKELPGTDFIRITDTLKDLSRDTGQILEKKSAAASVTSFWVAADGMQKKLIAPHGK